MPIIQALENWGLSSKEIKVYLACLELGSAPVQELAKKTGIERTNIYSLLESLIAKGVATEFEKHGKKYFGGENPEKLLTKLREKEKEVEEVLPELKSIYNLAPQKPKVRFYEGKEGYYTVCQETLDSGEKEVLQLGNLDDLWKVITKEYDDDYYIPTRIAKNIFSRLLLTKSPRIIEFRHKDPGCLRQTKFLQTKLPFQAYKFIFGNKVALISSEKELISLVIESKTLAEMEKAIFEELWQRAERAE